MDSWVVGVDCHARTLTAVRVDVVGRVQGERTVPNTAAGQQQVQRWAARAPGPRAWAVEGAGGHGRELTRRLREGKSRREAGRALKRHLARSIFRTIKRDLASGRTSFALT